MFTGIIEELGEIKNINRKRSGLSIDIALQIKVDDLSIGESIAVNGVCLTVVKVRDIFFTVDAVPETLEHSNIAGLKVKDKVNLERALKGESRLGGHIVSGHIDGVGYIRKKILRRDSCEMTISFPKNLRRYLVKKGSIAIDGISLTIADISLDSLRVAVIPHTLGVTTLGLKKVGDTVNIEADVLGKYVERQIGLKEGNKEKRAVNPVLF